MKRKYIPWRKLMGAPVKELAPDVFRISERTFYRRDRKDVLMYALSRQYIRIFLRRAYERCGFWNQSQKVQDEWSSIIFKHWFLPFLLDLAGSVIPTVPTLLYNTIPEVIQNMDRYMRVKSPYTPTFCGPLEHFPMPAISYFPMPIEPTYDPCLFP